MQGQQVYSRLGSFGGAAGTPSPPPPPSPVQAGGGGAGRRTPGKAGVARGSQEGAAAVSEAGHVPLRAAALRRRHAALHGLAPSRRHVADHHALRARLRLPLLLAVHAPPRRHGRRQLHRRVSNCMEANLQRWCLATLHTQSVKQFS